MSPCLPAEACNGSEAGADPPSVRGFPQRAGLQWVSKAPHSSCQGLIIRGRVFSDHTAAAEAVREVVSYRAASCEGQPRRHAGAHPERGCFSGNGASTGKLRLKASVRFQWSSHRIFLYVLVARALKLRPVHPCITRQYGVHQCSTRLRSAPGIRRIANYANYYYSFLTGTGIRGKSPCVQVPPPIPVLPCPRSLGAVAGGMSLGDGAVITSVVPDHVTLMRVVVRNSCHAQARLEPQRSCIVDWRMVPSLACFRIFGK